MKIRQDHTEDKIDEIHYTIDGVSLNLAGEVIFNNRKTRVIRRYYQDIYKSSLQDLVHAVFFGDILKLDPGLLSGISYSGNNYWENNDEGNPDASKEIIYHINKEESIENYRLIQPYDSSAVRNPEEVLINEIERKELISNIKALSTDYLGNSNDKELWEHLLLREFIIYGCYDPVMYSQGKAGPLRKPKKKPYLNDEECIHSIDTEVAEFFTKTVHDIARKYSISREKSRTFAPRLVLTHLAIYENYKNQLSIINRDNKLHYLPCNTRSSLSIYKSSLDSPEEKWRKITAPPLLHHVLKKSKDNNGHYFLKKLLEISNIQKGFWKIVRELGREIYIKITKNENIDYEKEKFEELHQN